MLKVPVEIIACTEAVSTQAPARIKKPALNGPASLMHIPGDYLLR